MLKKTVEVGGFSRLRAQAADIMNGFMINDPTTPQLILDAPIPSMGFLKYAVQDLSMDPKNEKERKALNCFITIGNCINAVQELTKSHVQSWAVTSLLSVVPVAGVDMNAYYDRRSLRFFYYNHKGNNTYFVDSADIVAHELGHALLDAMRPDFWDVLDLEIWSFHEAFSDITAVFNLMNHDSVIESVLVETGGDLRKSNAASRLAEQVGMLLKSVTKNPNYLGTALRDPATELFKYVDPSTLPEDAENNRLAAECHSFGRVFSAAWYNAFVKVYELVLAREKNRSAAFKISRDICFQNLVKAAILAPRVPNFYAAVAKSMVGVSQGSGNEYSKIFSEVFQEWQILGPDSMKALSSASWSEVVFKLKRGDKVLKTKNGGALVSMRRPTTVKVSDIPMDIDVSALADISVEVPSDIYYEFDPSGKVIDEMIPARDQIVKSAARCIKQALSDDMWEQREGKLVRKFIR